MARIPLYQQERLASSLTGVPGPDTSALQMAGDSMQASSQLAGTFGMLSNRIYDERRGMFLGNLNNLAYQMRAWQQTKQQAEAQRAKMRFDTDISNLKVPLSHKINEYAGKLQRENMAAPHMASDLFSKGLEKDVLKEFFSDPRFQNREDLVNELRQFANGMTMQKSNYLQEWGADVGFKQTLTEADAINEELAAAPGAIDSSRDTLFESYGKLNERFDAMVGIKGEPLAKAELRKYKVDGTTNFLNSLAERDPNQTIKLLTRNTDEWTKAIGMADPNDPNYNNLVDLHKSLFSIPVKQRDSILRTAQSKIKSDIQHEELQQTNSLTSLKSRIISRGKDIPEKNADPLMLNQQIKFLDEDMVAVEQMPDSSDKVMMQSYIKGQKDKFEAQLRGDDEARLKAEEEKVAKAKQGKIEAKQTLQEIIDTNLEKGRPFAAALNANIKRYERQVNTKGVIPDAKLLDQITKDLETANKDGAITPGDYNAKFGFMEGLREEIRLRGAKQEKPGLLKQITDAYNGFMGIKLPDEAHNNFLKSTPEERETYDSQYRDQVTAKMETFRKNNPNLKQWQYDAALNSYKKNIATQFAIKKSKK